MFFFSEYRVGSLEGKRVERSNRPPKPTGNETYLSLLLLGSLPV